MKGNLLDGHVFPQMYPVVWKCAPLEDLNLKPQRRTTESLPSLGSLLQRLNLCAHHSVCRVMKVAKSFLDQGKSLSFAVANKNVFSQDIAEMGLDASTGELPVIAVRTGKGDKYVMSEEFT